MTTRPPLLYLNGDDVRRALPMGEAIAAMREAFISLSSGHVAMPARSVLDLGPPDGHLMIMPCHATDAPYLGLKVLSQFQANRASGLPLIQALVFLVDARGGQPLAILEGAALTALRTGAASGLATDVLARRDADVVAIFGAGTQARTQLEAVCAVRSIRVARVFDTDRSAAEHFASGMSRTLEIPVVPVATPSEALDGALVVCTATNSRTPLFHDQDVVDGAHLNAVGSWKPETREIPGETIRRARVVIDQVEAALEEAGDLLMPLKAGQITAEHVSVELGAVLTGRAPARRGHDEITLFKSVGPVVQDLFAASRAYEFACRNQIGITLAR